MFTLVGGSLVFHKDIGGTDSSIKNNLTESSSRGRFLRFYNPLINYDYKTGNYIGNWESQYPYLINSFIEVARGIRKPVWFLSDQYIDLFKANYDKFLVNFTGKGSLKLSNPDNWYNAHVTPLMHITNNYYLFYKNYNMNGFR
jgi:hypothetical protein